ncbi:MAG: hypothetical protein ACLFSL_03275 [Candidatus Woesearchaeota archaeon]
MLFIRTLRSKDTISETKLSPPSSMLIIMFFCLLMLSSLCSYSVSGDSVSNSTFENISSKVTYDSNISSEDEFRYNESFNLMNHSVDEKVSVNGSVIFAGDTEYNVSNVTKVEDDSILVSFNPVSEGHHELVINYSVFNDTRTSRASFMVNDTGANQTTDQVAENASNVSDEALFVIDIGDFEAEINFNDTYYYVPGNTSVEGDARIMPKNDSNLSGSYSVDMTISPRGSKRNFSCTHTSKGNLSFSCPFPDSVIEITEYDVYGNIIYENTTRPFNTSFELALEEADLDIETSYRNFINFTDEQIVEVNAYVLDEQVHEPQLTVKIIHPDGAEEHLNLSKENDEDFIGKFKPRLSGIHEIEAMAVVDGKLSSTTEQFRVLEDDTEIKLEVPESIRHNYGKLNLSGNVTITESDSFISESVKLYYRSSTSDEAEDKGDELCDFNCSGHCGFSCVFDGIMEYSEYNLTSQIELNDKVYSDTATVDVIFDEQDVDFNLSYSPEYLKEQRQNFFVEPLYQEETLEKGKVYAEITDPSDIVYRITPEQLHDGYMFTFVGLEPGDYILNLTFISELGYKDEIFTYKVIENVSEMPDEHSSEVIARDRKIRDALSAGRLKELNMSEKNLFIQLPFRLNENVSWAILSRNMSSSVFEEKDFIPESIQRLRLSEYIPRSSYEDFSGYELSYAETPPIETETDLISENAMKLLLPKSAVNLEDVTVSMDILELPKGRRENILVTDLDTESIVSDIRYEGKKDKVDQIEFEVEELSSAYKVEMLTEDPFFKVKGPDRVRMGTSSTVSVDFKNPDVSLDEDNISCSIVIEGVTEEMIPSPRTDSFIYPLEYDSPGKKEYVVACDSYSKDMDVMVTEPREIESFSERSASIRKDNSTRVLMSHNSPQHYKTDNGWKRIDPNFHPRLRGRRNSSGSKGLEYVADNGPFSVYLSDLGEDDPFVYEVGSNNLSFSISSISLYNTSSDEIITSLEPDKDSPFMSEGDEVIYDNIFGHGTSQAFTYMSSGLKLELIVDQTESELFRSFATAPDDLEVSIEYRIHTGDLRIDPQEGVREIPLRTIDYEDAGTYIMKDYYYPKDNISARVPMYREVSGSDGNYTIVSTMSYDDFLSHDKIVIDPSFSIVTNDRDAMSVDNETVLDYYSEDSQYLRFGHGNQEEYQTGLQFQLDVPFGSNITDAYITLISGDSNAGDSINATIMMENSTDVDPFQEGTGNISSREYLSDMVLWELTSWDQDEEYETPDISRLIQDIVDDPRWESGNYMGLMLSMEEDVQDNFRSLHGYSSPGDNMPVLVVAYESDEAAPIVMLEDPAQGAYLSDEELNFSYTPYDEDGLDGCELWGDFGGDWKHVRTDDDPVEGSTNVFENVSMDEGNFIWNVWCSDQMGNAAFNDSNSGFTIDRTAPSIVLESPSNNSVVSDMDLSFKFNSSDQSDELICDLSYGFLGEEPMENITDINATTAEMTEISRSNLSTGDYEWEVDCVDEAGNVGNSGQSYFSISRDSSLDIFSDHDHHANHSVHEVLGFYANYTNSSGDVIDDGDCVMTYNDTEDMDFNDTTSLHELYRSFVTPYNQSYEVNCTSALYEDSATTAHFYLYPLLNTLGSKSIQSFEENQYHVSLDYMNRHNTTVRLILHDFLPADFSADFSQEPDDSSSFIAEGFIGTTYKWEFILEPYDRGNVTYNVTPEKKDYRLSGLYIGAISSMMLEEQ